MNLEQIRSAVTAACESADNARPEDVSVGQYRETNTVYLETDMYIPPHVLSAVAELGYEPRDVTVMVADSPESAADDVSDSETSKSNGHVRVPLTEHYRFKYE